MPLRIFVYNYEIYTEYGNRRNSCWGRRCGVVVVSSKDRANFRFRKQACSFDQLSNCHLLKKDHNFPGELV